MPRGAIPNAAVIRHAHGPLALSSPVSPKLPRPHGTHIRAPSKGQASMKTKTSQGPEVLKWSSKPADHNATRVRNNQRRHRARARGHVQDLERRLAETSAGLEAALQTISHLAREVETLRGRLGESPTAVVLPRPPSNPATPPGVAAAEAEAQSRADPAPVGDVLLAPGEVPEIDSPPTVMRAAAAAPPPTSGADDDGDADCGCDGSLPPRAPGESTLPCGSAFRIIEQQNFSGVEVTTIRAWLGPGFRRAPGPGKACRVETGRVYELLDHITSSSSSSSS